MGLLLIEKSLLQPLYKSIEAKEPEMNMLLLQSADRKQQLTKNGTALATELQQQWPQLLHSTRQRQAALDSASKLGNEFDGTYQSADNNTTEVERQLASASKELSDIDALYRQGEQDAILASTLGDRLVKATTDDHDVVRDKLNTLKSRRSAARAQLDGGMKDAEARKRLAASATALVDDADRALNRAQEQTRALDTLSRAASQAKLRSLIDDVKGPIAGKIDAADGEVRKASAVGADPENTLTRKVSEMRDRASSLNNDLDRRAGDIDDVERRLGQLHETGRGLARKVKTLQRELSDAAPVGRDVDTLQSQLSDQQDMCGQINEAQDVLFTGTNRTRRPG